VLRREGVDRGRGGKARREGRTSRGIGPSERGGYKHFMLKEIHEQPTACLDTFRTRQPEKGRVILDDEPA
jgi:glucosamine 6-phosphate synthetase-like amidotransferase/phosphosugar isomerase protein